MEAHSPVLCTRFGAVSFPEYRDLAAALGPGAELVAHFPNSAILTGLDGPKPAWLELVSDNYFSALGIRTTLGAPFTVATAGAGAAPRIVIRIDCGGRDSPLTRAWSVVASG